MFVMVTTLPIMRQGVGEESPWLFSVERVDGKGGADRVGQQHLLPPSHELLHCLVDEDHKE